MVIKIKSKYQQSDPSIDRKGGQIPINKFNTNQNIKKNVFSFAVCAVDNILRVLSTFRAALI